MGILGGTGIVRREVIAIAIGLVRQRREAQLAEGREPRGASVLRIPSMTNCGSGHP